MAKTVENKNGFLVLEVSREECQRCFHSGGICDYCNGTDKSGYYIAVLNRWYCPECYNGWIQRAVRYMEDIRIEEKNFRWACKVLNVNE
jgi:hypothetical protein